MANKAEQSLISDILGASDPGDDGRQDEVNNNDVLDDTGQDDGQDDGGELDNQDIREPEGDEPPEGDEDEGLEDEAPDADDDDDPLRARRRDTREEEDDQNRREPPATANLYDLRAKVQRDPKTGHLYVNGKLVAKSGREAIMFQALRKEGRKEMAAAQDMAIKLRKLAGAAQTVLAENDTLKKQKTLFDTAGMTASEQAQALELALAFKKNPTEGVKLFLTRAHLAGVDITKLGAGGGIDPKLLLDEMKAHINTAMTPVLRQTSEQQRRRQIESESAGFFTRNRAAKAVAKIVGGGHRLAQIIQQGMEAAPDLTMDEIFQKLHYQLLVDGKMTTGPVARSRSAKDRRLNRNFSRELEKPRTQRSSIPSFDEIAQSVLEDARLADNRGQ